MVLQCTSAFFLGKGEWVLIYFSYLQGGRFFEMERLIELISIQIHSEIRINYQSKNYGVRPGLEKRLRATGKQYIKSSFCLLTQTVSRIWMEFKFFVTTARGPPSFVLTNVMTSTVVNRTGIVFCCNRKMKNAN